MLKGSDIIGLPVVTFDSGEKIEKVTDVVFDHSTNQVLAFLVDEGGWFSSARVVPFEALQTVGSDALIVPVKSAVVEAGRVPAVAKILERDNVLKGTKIMTTDGRDLGSMRDLYFDEESGRVEGFEVSGGLFADAYEGRSFVPAPQTLTIGEDVAFVPPETAGLMEEQVGGVKGAAQTLGDRIKEGAEAAGEKIQSGAESAKEKLQAGSETVRQRLDDAQAATTGAVSRRRRAGEPGRPCGTVTAFSWWLRARSSRSQCWSVPATETGNPSCSRPSDSRPAGPRWLAPRARPAPPAPSCVRGRRS